MKAKHLGFLAGLLLTPQLATAGGVVVGDREWRQPIETAGFTWAQMASVCSPTTGTCNGSINGVVLDGWTWASIEDVQELFERLIKPDSIQFATLSNDSNYLATDDPDIRAALGPGGFAPSFLNPTRVGGWTRSVFMFPPLYFAPYLVLDDPGVQQDFACLYCASVEAGGFVQSSWLFRAATTQQVLESLATSVASRGPGASLSSKIKAAQAYVAAGDVTSACSVLKSFLSQVSAQTAKKLTSAQAAALTADAQALQRVIGCN